MHLSTKFHSNQLNLIKIWCPQTDGRTEKQTDINSTLAQVCELKLEIMSYDTTIMPITFIYAKD